jgi:hypothetical protein
MVLVGERSTKQSHDSITHDMVDGALEAVNGLHHMIENGIEELSGLLGVAFREQFHRALKVGKQHCNLLAFAFERSFRSQDLLSQVPRRVGLRRIETRCRKRDLLANRSTALGAKLGGRRQLGSTAGAHQCQVRTTLLAVLRPRATLVPALGTLHEKPSRAV